MSPGSTDQERFAEVFAHLGRIAAYARTRGAADPEAIAAEVMTIAWRRLDDVPRADPRPWLIATARNLVAAEWRRRAVARRNGSLSEPVATQELGISLELDPELERALRELSESDREALLLVAWEDLTSAQAAASLGISSAAFRVRLHRARRRLARRLRPDEHPRRLEEGQPRWEQP